MSVAIGIVRDEGFLRASSIRQDHTKEGGVRRTGCQVWYMAGSRVGEDPPYLQEIDGKQDAAGR